MKHRIIKSTIHTEHGYSTSLPKYFKHKKNVVDHMLQVGQLCQLFRAEHKGSYGNLMATTTTKCGKVYTA